MRQKKRRTEKVYIGILTEEESKWLTTTKDSIGVIEAEVSKKLETEPSKLERLKLIKNKNEEVERFKNEQIKGNERKRIILMISNLNADNLSSFKKISIKEGIRSELNKLLEEGVIKDFDSYSFLVSKLTKRALRFAVKSMQKNKYEMIMQPNADLSNILLKT